MRREDRNEGRKAVRAAERRPPCVISKHTLRYHADTAPGFPRRNAGHKIPNTAKKWTTQLLWKLERGEGEKKMVGGTVAQCDAERELRGAQKRRRKIWGAQSSRAFPLAQTRRPRRIGQKLQPGIRSSSLLFSLFHSSLAPYSPPWTGAWSGSGRLIHSRQCQSAHTSKMRSRGERGAQRPKFKQ